MDKYMKLLIFTTISVVLTLLYSCAYVYYNVDLEPFFNLWYVDFTFTILKVIGVVILFLIATVVLAGLFL